ncbi:unnamed protein product [Diatraea saccharalis]|uniref:HMG box domain-containing protein n=1 Tax=Diatraea saccharalis TaxID=40085 RepID=A0A9N9WF85_9NEOP|nr:unnamed protein product [Diatraea saccharalis]
MPKKQPRNAFYFFMIDYKEEQRKKGINYANMAEVAEAAGPLWRDAPPSVRKKFEEMAKKEKQKKNIPEMKFTSTGVSFAEIDRQEKELKEAEENERQDIKNIVKLKSFNGDIINEDFYLIDVNYFCKAGNEYIIAESTVLRFNLKDGIKDQYHEIINPGKIPVGYASDVKLGSQEIGLEMPDESLPRTNYFQILANLIDYLKQQNPDVKAMPPLFTMPEKVAPVHDFILQMCTRAAEDDSIFRVYKLDTLFFTLINAIKSRSDEGFPKDSLALAQLKKDPFKYTPGLGCEIHEETDKCIECSTSRVKRWAYTVLDSCCPVAALEMRPGDHVPHDTDLDSVLTYKEQKKTRAGPSVAGRMYAPSSSNTSAVNESLNESGTSLDTPKKEKPAHVPLRMPKTDYSRTIRPAPELTEDNFPSLSAGRGRGLSGSFGKMNINKK